MSEGKNAVIGFLIGLMLGCWLGAYGSVSMDERAVASGYLIHERKAYRVVPVHPEDRP